MSAVNWIPHNAQKLIFTAAETYRFLVLVCGRRFGKTEMIINKLIKASWEDPGDYVYIAPTYKVAKRIAWRKLKALFPSELKCRRKWKDEQELTVENSRGGRVILLGADNPDSLRGSGWKGCIFDEFEDVDMYTWNACVRPALSDYEGWCWFLGTPKGHHNLYEMFIRDKDYNDPNYKTINDDFILIDPDFKAFQFKTEDNPHIPRKEIENARRTMNDDYYRQEYEASFESYTGLCYREFMMNRNKYILEPLIKNDIVYGCLLNGEAVLFQQYFFYYLGLDTGRHTAAVLKVVDDQGREFIIDEVYDIDGLVRDISGEINKKLRARNIRGKVIDSASQVKREYMNSGLSFVDSIKDPYGAIQITRRKQREGKWFVLSNCTATIRELSARRWDEKKKGGKPKPVKENDHACNAEDYIQTTFLDNARRTFDIVNPELRKRQKDTLLHIVQQHEVHELEAG